MASIWEEFDTAPSVWDDFDREARKRTMVEAVADVGVSAAGGVGSVIEGVGTLYGLSTGDMENGLREFGKGVSAYWQEKKSPGLLAREMKRREKIDSTEGQLGKAWAAIRETATDSGLLTSFLSEQLPMLVPGMAAGRAAGIGATALGATEKVARGTALGTGIGTFAAQQGADVGGDTYDRIRKLPQELIDGHPAYQALVQSGVSPEKARDAVAQDEAKVATLLSAGVSVASMLVPGGTTVERLLVGAGMKHQGAAAIVRGMLGEATQEAVEEGGGQVVGNIGVRKLDPSQGLTEGVGEAAGMGGLMGGAFGGGFSAAASRRRDEPAKPPVEEVRTARSVQEIFNAPTVEGAIAAATLAVEEPVYESDVALSELGIIGREMEPTARADLLTPEAAAYRQLEAAKEADLDRIQTSAREDGYVEGAEDLEPVRDLRTSVRETGTKTAMQIAMERVTLARMEELERQKESVPNLGIKSPNLGMQPESKAVAAQPATQDAPAEVRVFGKPVADLGDAELAQAAQTHPMSAFRESANLEIARRTPPSKPVGDSQSLGQQVRELSLATQKEAGWNPDWPFIPADLQNADFRDLIRNDPGIDQAEKEAIFAAGRKLDVVPALDADVTPAPPLKQRVPAEIPPPVAEKATTVAELRTPEPKIAGRPVSEMPERALQFAAKGGSPRVRTAAAAELERRAAAGDGPVVVPEDAKETMRVMAENSGHLERGGQVVREMADTQTGGDAVGVTRWIGQPEWAKGLNANPQEVKTAAEKAIAGKPMGAKQRDIVRAMLAEIEATRANLATTENLAEEGIDQTPQNIEEVNLLARAAALDEAGFERLAMQHEGRPDSEFLAAVVQFVKERSRENQRPDAPQDQAGEEARQAQEVASPPKQVPTERPAGAAEALAKYDLPADTGWNRGRGPISNKWAAAADGVESNYHETADAAAKELREFLDAARTARGNRERVEAAQKVAADKVRRGENPSFEEWKAAFPQLREGHTYLRQPDISPFLVEHFGFSKANIRGPLGEAAGTVTSDSGAQYPIVYFNRLAKVLGQARPSLDLAGETEAEVRRKEADRARAEEEKRRREAAPPADDFTLTGSSRSADEAAARGQMELAPANPVAAAADALIQAAEAMKAAVAPTQVEVIPEKSPEELKADARIRELMKLDKAVFEAFDPVAAVSKRGRGWSYTTTSGTQHPGIYDTKREATEAAQRHKELKLEQYEDPSSYWDVTSLIAGEHLKLMEKYQSEGMTEQDAARRAEKEVPHMAQEPSAKPQAAPRASAGGERTAINAVFDKFINTLQTKETERGVAMFSRAEARSVGAWADAPLDESAYVQMDDVRKLEFAPYIREDGVILADSRTTPNDRAFPVVGTWRISDHEGPYGREIEKLTEVSLDKLILNELDSKGRLDPVKAGDDERYAQWLAEGRRAPPINIVQTDSGKLSVTDGHRRALAAKRMGAKTIEAWVNFAVPIPSGWRYDGKPDTKFIRTGLTFEMLTGAVPNEYVNDRMAFARAPTTKVEELRKQVLALEDAIGQTNKDLAAMRRYAARNPKYRTGTYAQEFKRLEADEKVLQRDLGRARRELSAADKALAELPPLEDSRNQMTLFGRTDDGRAYRRAPKRFDRLDVADVRRIVAPILRNWNNAPDIEVIASITEAPDVIRRLDEQQRVGGAKGEPEAFLHGDTVYLVASAMSSERAVLRALFHESMGHFGLRGVLGQEIETVLNEVLRSLPQKVNAKAREYGLNVVDQDQAMEAAEEVLAEMAQTMPNANIVQKAIAAIRRWLRKMGVNLKLSDNDIVVNYLLPARRFVERGGRGRRGRGGLQFERQQPWFYSDLSRKLTDLKRDAGTAAEWKAIIAQLPGVKKDEIEWSGVNEWLDLQTGKVEKSALLDYLSQNGVRVEETVLGDPAGVAAATRENDALVVELDSMGYTIETAPSDVTGGLVINGLTHRSSGESWSFEQGTGFVDSSQGTELPARVQEIGLRLAELEQEMPTAETGGDIGNTRYSQYTLPGGKNYRELLLTLPTQKNPEAEARRIMGEEAWAKMAQSSRDELIASQTNPATRDAFRSAHFDAPNILAHIRFDERTDSTDARVLFIEEVQSDWAQKGKREGFQGPPVTLDEIEREDGAYKVKFSDGSTSSVGMGTIGRDVTDNGVRAYYSNILREKNNLRSVPPAPFVGKTEAWVSLALKRMIAYGAEHGFDKISWTTGEQQADRYDLSKQVERVSYRVDSKGYDLVARRVGDTKMTPIADNIPAEKLADYVGKDLAEKIKRGEGTKGAQDWKAFEGVSLKIGGEGMRAFYDKIVPNVANDVLKKLGGGRVGTIPLEAGEWTVRVNEDGEWGIYDEAAGKFLPSKAYRTENEAVDAMMAMHVNPQPGFDITPALRERALQGLPLFSRRAPSDVRYAQHRSTPWPADADKVISTSLTVKEVQAHKDYAAAKAGDEQASLRLIRDLVRPAKIREIRQQIGSDVLFVPVASEEAAGDNKLPQALAEYAAFLLNTNTVEDVTEDGAVHHTGADPMERLIARPVFKGEIEAGRKYVLVDDVTTMGGTLAALADYIQRQGGQVAGALVLSNASRSGKMTPSKGVVREIERRYGDEVRNLFGIEPAALTSDEAGYIIGFRDAAALEARAAAARHETDNRLRARGVGKKPAEGVGRFSRAPAWVEGQSGNRASWDAPEPGKLDAFIRVIQDKHVDTKRVVQAIKNASGVLKDSIDVYLQEELFHGRTSKGVHEFLDMELRPLFTDMVGRGVTMAELEEYLHARHAEERNIQIAKVNPEMPDGGSGMDTADAREYLEKLDSVKKRAFEALAVRVDAINARTRQALVGYGLESQEAIQAWEEAYQNYVPLQREDMEWGMGVGQGFSVRGSQKRATGSKRAVVDILANIAMQRERVIVRGEKNRVANALVGLAQANPNPDFWRVDRPKTIKYIDERTGLVAERPDPLFKSRENVVVARMPDATGNVVEHAVIFNERDERAMRMATALKNLDAHDMGEVLGLAAKVTRYFASINTQYNPVFGIVNLTRDTQGALFNLSSTPLAGKQVPVLQNTISALRGIYIDERAARKGEQPKSAWAELWDEFQREGGQTGYRDMFRTSKDRAEDIERELKRITEGKAKQFGRAVFDWLSDYNQAMENAVRLAAYKVGKENGMTNQRAASLAKNLTVNFNRRGSYGTQVGALYAFFNASVQGTARLAETLKGPAGKKIITGGLLLGSMQALLLAAMGFDDDEPPDFVRERNLIIPIGGKKYITIPMPLGLHILPNLGRIPTEFALTGFREPHKRISELVNVFTDAFNPVGNAGLSLQTIAPTIIDPVAALAENKDWTGKPIARKDFSALNPTPGHTRSKDTASEFSKAVSIGLNWLSGGTNYKPGLFSPTPDQIDYLIGQVAGGLGREAMKIEQTITSSFTGEELPTYKIPVLSRFYGSSEGQAAQGGAFYDNLREINQHEAEIKGRRKAGEPLGDYIRENPETRLIQYANKVERQVSTLRRRRRELIQKNATPDQVRALDARITHLMRSFNDRVRSLREKEAA